MFSRHEHFGIETAGNGSLKRRLLQGLAAAAAAVGIVTLAYAADGARPHQALTLEEAKALAATIEVPSDFQITVNPAVLERLNKVITDPPHAAAFRDALERMTPLRPKIAAALARFGFPEVLLAVPLVESGYRNLPQAAEKTSTGGPYGAGYWMFIRDTGRRYGLEINGAVDERLDLEKETDAALRLLRDERLVFDDWLLALAAYNLGERAVDAAIKRGGSRDAWTLVEQGQFDNYLVLTTAGIILMNHPELVQ